VAPLLLALSLYRPFTESRGRAGALPEALPSYQLVERHEMTPRQYELLGTNDAAWRTYRDAAGHEVYLVALYHEENWKSVHPPRICLEGSDMSIVEEGEVELPGGAGTAGRIVAHSRSGQRDYISVYVYGAPDLLTGSYLSFVWHHAPRAVLRRPTRGFLLRVESFVESDGTAAAVARCVDFLTELVPSARALLEP
jgi:EpsI family protein